MKKWFSAGQRVSTGSPGEARWKSLFRNLFSIDPRSLALFRIAVALLLLTDLAIRAGDLKVMYTDDGMFPREEISRLINPLWNWSLHFAGGSWGFQAVLFGIAAVFAVALLTGFGTRIAIIGSWILLVSVHHRVPPVISGAEILLRMLLFWGMFLPLGKVWSIDSWRKKRGGMVLNEDAGSPVVSIATAAVLLQMGLMYLFSAIFKTNSQWTGGEVLAGVLAHDFYGSPAGAYLLRYPGFLKILTQATLALEWAAPLLLFVPRRTGLRLGIIGVLAVMHLGIGICLEVGLFPYVALAGLALFLPTAFWNSGLLARLSRSQSLAAKSAPVLPPLLRDIPQRLCLALLLYVIAININSLRSRPLAPLKPETWMPLVRGLGLGQSWGVFEAVPSMDGWFIARAKLRDRTEVDLLRPGAEVDWEKPAFPAGLYPNHYWQKLFREMAYTDDKGYQLFRPMVAAYLCREWNARHDAEKQVIDFEFIYCMEIPEEFRQPDASRIYRESLYHLDPANP